MWAGCNVHRGHICGHMVSGFLAVDEFSYCACFQSHHKYRCSTKHSYVCRSLAYSHTWLHSLLWACVHIQSLIRVVASLKTWPDELGWQQLLRVFCGFHLIFSVFFTWKPDSGRRGWSVLISCPIMKPRCTPRPGSWEPLPLLWSTCILSVSPGNPIYLSKLKNGFCVFLTENSAQRRWMYPEGQ